MTTPTPQPIPAGWYPDPALATSSETGERYWDGTTWTQHTRTSQTPQTDPATGLVPSPTGAEYATWLQRGAGYIIDGLLFAPLYIALAVLFIINLINDPAFIQLMEDVSANNALTANDLTLEQQTDILNAMRDSAQPLIIWYFLILLLTALYWIISIATWGRTIGGAIMGIRAVDRNGNTPSYGASIIRYGVIFGFTLLMTIAQFIPVAGSLLGMAASALLLVCFLSMLWSPSRQAWQDKAAGTYVIQTREKRN